MTGALPLLDLAVVFGSGLAVVPDGLTVEAELGYEELGWPVTGVGGHASRLLVARPSAHAVAGAAGAAAGDGPRVGLAFGRPHLYEGWSREELERPVRDLCAAGARRLLLTNTCGGLRPSVAPGHAVVVTEVVDLQSAPREEPERLPATSPPAARALIAALTRRLPVQVGAYVAVAGPQYETPAEVAWLAGYGHVVGMSTAPEVRAAHACGREVEVVAFVVNRAAEVGEHADVLAAAAAFSAELGPLLGSIVVAAPPARPSASSTPTT